MKRGKVHNMFTVIWNLWAATEIKVGVLFSILWLCFDTLVGGFDEQINALCILVSLDIFTGVWASFHLHSFMSSIASKGLFKKATMFLIIGLGVLLDTAMHTTMIRTLFISAFSIVEVLSIIENMDKLGYGQYIPVFIRDCLAQIAKEKKVTK